MLQDLGTSQRITTPSHHIKAQVSMPHLVTETLNVPLFLSASVGRILLMLLLSKTLAYKVRPFVACQSDSTIWTAELRQQRCI